MKTKKPQIFSEYRSLHQYSKATSRIMSPADLEQNRLRKRAMEEEMEDKRALYLVWELILHTLGEDSLFAAEAPVTLEIQGIKSRYVIPQEGFARRVKPLVDLGWSIEVLRVVGREEGGALIDSIKVMSAKPLSEASQADSEASQADKGSCAMKLEPKPPKQQQKEQEKEREDRKKREAYRVQTFVWTKMLAAFDDKDIYQLSEDVPFHAKGTPNTFHCIFDEGDVPKHKFYENVKPLTDMGWDITIKDFHGDRKWIKRIAVKATEKA